MTPNKKIDRLFQEKLKDLELNPPNIVWENIEAHLNRKKKRRIIPIWFRFAGAAAILLLLTFGTIKYLQSSTNTNQPQHIISDTEISDSENTGKQKLDVENNPESITPKTEVANTNDSPNSTDTSEKNLKSKSTEIANAPNKKNSLNSQTEKLSIQNNLVAKKADFEKAKKNDSENSIAQLGVKESNNKNVISDDVTILPKNEYQSKENTIALNETVAIASKTNTNPEKNNTYQNIENLEDPIESKEIENLKKESETLNNRWTVASIFAPIYYNSFNSKGSPLDSQFENNAKEGSQSISYGIKIGYQLSEKLSLQSGVTLMNIGYGINDIYVNPNAQFESLLTNVKYTSNNNVLALNVSDQMDQNQLETKNTQSISGDLNQEYGYIEIPMELKYNISNGKLGVYVVAGFSTLFLNNNSVIVKTDLFSSDLGEAKNLNEINFSGNFGLDLDFKINQNFFINVAPMLKIHTRTFSGNSKNFKPYVIGVYTGLNYRF